LYRLLLKLDILYQFFKANRPASALGWRIIMEPASSAEGGYWTLSVSKQWHHGISFPEVITFTKSHLKMPSICLVCTIKIRIRTGSVLDDSTPVS
jgi:hypothetical protein